MFKIGDIVKINLSSTIHSQTVAAQWNEDSKNSLLEICRPKFSGQFECRLVSGEFRDFPLGHLFYWRENELKLAKPIKILKYKDLLT